MVWDRSCGSKAILVRTRELEWAKSTAVAVGASGNRQLYLGIFKLEAGEMLQKFSACLRCSPLPVVVDTEPDRRRGVAAVTRDHQASLLAGS